jgi:hypothetical protein
MYRHAKECAACGRRQYWVELKTYFSSSDITRVPLMRIPYNAIDMNRWTLSVWRQLNTYACWLLCDFSGRCEDMTLDEGLNFFQILLYSYYATFCNFLSHKNATTTLQQNWLYVDFQFCILIRSNHLWTNLPWRKVYCAHLGWPLICGSRIQKMSVHTYRQRWNRQHKLQQEFLIFQMHIIIIWKYHRLLFKQYLAWQTNQFEL